MAIGEVDVRLPHGNDGTAMGSPDTIACPLCELPHLATAVRCDDCGQALHKKVNIGRLKDEAERLHRTVYVAGALSVAALIASFLLVSVIGGAVLLMAPFGWGLSAWWRLRALRRNIGRLERLG